ncbi:BUD31/G10-related, conserved site-containing protein [Cynara cardunculus var. scolymus]|uniref:BUD31/G10-related, conserved site-containing protein n=3 Tax=Cardueae TaxID=102818 RepID=A0A103YF43_CYNCS|nr:BUD31/G10-related, conserved site-containing protein [Cynara cardunculus var. scolymus]
MNADTIGGHVRFKVLEGDGRAATTADLEVAERIRELGFWNKPFHPCTESLSFSFGGIITTLSPAPPSPETVSTPPLTDFATLPLAVGRMPKVKTNRVKYPEGWELIEPTLRELQGKMREAENDPHDGKRKCETLWPIFKIAHQKSRYIFDLYHRRREISKELYEFCLDQGYADRNIIAKWKKPGYERLCCLRCIQPRDHNFQTTCVCRVPKHLREEKVIECVHCGCKGCASGD